MNQEQLYDFCAANPDLRVELTAAGNIDNEQSPGLRPIARGGAGRTEIVTDLEMWGRIEREWSRD
jgi:hypothetical protein